MAKSESLDNCEICLESKMRKGSNKGELIVTNEPGQIIHVDSYTPKIKTMNNLNTAFVFGDEGSRLLHVKIFIKNR